MFKARVEQSPAFPDGNMLRVSLELSMQELLQRRQEDILDMVMQRLAHSIADTIGQVLAKPGNVLHQMIQSELHKEIKEQVKIAVAERVDELVEDMLA